jgi:hypothetical protein
MKNGKTLWLQLMNRVESLWWLGPLSATSTEIKLSRRLSRTWVSLKMITRKWICVSCTMLCQRPKTKHNSNWTRKPRLISKLESLLHLTSFCCLMLTTLRLRNLWLTIQMPSSLLILKSQLIVLELLSLKSACNLQAKLVTNLPQQRVTPRWSL